MAVKSLHCILLMLLLAGSFAFGQTDQSASGGNEVGSTPGSSSYTLEETDEGTRFVQRLDWAPAAGIVRYEIVLEQRYGNSSRYDEFLRETSGEAFVNVSLPAGNYRYKVLGYNILGRLGAESDYLYFEVFQAVQALINEISPREWFLDDEGIRRVTLTGEHFVLGSEIYLVPIRRNSTDNSAAQSGVLVPSNIIYSDIGDSAELVFDNQPLSVGAFRIIVVNPGGLTAVYESLQIKRFTKPMDVNVSLGYAPLIPADSSSDLSKTLGLPFYPLGFSGRLSFIPLKTWFGFFGAEFSPFYSYASVDLSSFSVQTHILGAALSVLYQKPFLNEKLFLNIRLGGGIASYSDLQFIHQGGGAPDSLSVIFPEAQFGASVHYFVYKKVFIELGIDSKLFFAKDMFTVYVNPFLSAGWRF